MLQSGANRALARRMVLTCLALALSACAGAPPRAGDPAAPPPATEAAAPRPGLLGGLFGPRPGRTPAPDPAATEADGPGPEVTTAALETEAPQRAGLFGAGADPAKGVLPFGQIEKVCGVGKRDLGKEVAKSRGRGTYRLYDTDPSSIEPRTQYITGFKDGCARQFTASLALFGTAQVHETTRYNPLNSNPYSETDLAYEKIKMRVCRVKKGEFCPDRPAKRMDRDAAFLSVYRQFGGTGAWMEVFLHRGRLVSYSAQGG